MRRWPAATTAGIAVGLGAIVAPEAAPAMQKPTPSERDVRQSEREVRERRAALGRTQARLAKADAELEKLDARTEALVEAYNGSVVKLTKARSEYGAATRHVREAEARAERERSEISRFAGDSYTVGDSDSPDLALVAGPQEPQDFLARLNTLRYLGDHRGAMLEQAEAAQEVSRILRAVAGKALAEQKKAAERARAAKAVAKRATEEQRGQVVEIERRKKALERRLASARARTGRLKQAREAERNRVAARNQAAAQRKTTYQAAGARRTGAGRGDVAANWALTQLGKPYLWAGVGPDRYDCSGLTMRAWEKVGVRLDHWTGTQWTSGPRIPTGRLKRGDLVFFGRITRDPGTIHHVGMYVGRGNMVHAPRTGDVIKISPIWRSDLVGAVRPT